MPATLNNKAAKFTPKSTPARPASAADHQSPTPLALPVDAITRARPPRHYTREELKDVKRQMRDLTSDRIFDWMLNGLIKRHLDLVDPEQIAQSARKNAFPETCIKCIGKLCPNAPGGSPPPSAWQEPPCDAIADIVQSVVAEERSKHGAFLVQDAQAVFGLVQHQLAFDSPSTSSKLKKLKRDHPKVVDIIKSFLCGKGFHFPPPKADNDDAWNALLSRLRFDWIRDNRTIIFTELSKTWKKRHSPFEQFAHFLFFRDEVPAFRSLGMITHAQKPLLVAALAGDTTAFVLLARLGFCVMPDAVWENTSILKESLDTRRYAVLRHLNTYFFRKQFERPSPMTLIALQPAPAPQTLARNTPPLIPVQLPMRVWEQRPPRHHHHNTVKRESQRSPVNDAAFEASLPMESVSPALQPTAPAGSWAKAVRSAKPIGTSPVVSPQVSPAQPPTTTTPPKAEPSKKGAAATKKASA